MKKIEERTRSLIREVFSNLPKKIKNSFREKGIKFCKFYSEDSYFHHMHGCVAKTNPYRVNLNLFNIPELSDNSVKAVIAHELGHSYIIQGKDNYFNFLIKIIPKQYRKKFEENRADKLAKKWGFGKEISCLRKEAVFRRIHYVNEGFVDVYAEEKKISSDERRVDIFLKCDKCNSNYKIEYYSFGYKTRAFLIKNRHHKAELDFDYPIHFKKLLKGFECMECENKELEIKVIKLP